MKETISSERYVIFICHMVKNTGFAEHLYPCLYFDLLNLAFCINFTHIFTCFIKKYVYYIYVTFIKLYISSFLSSYFVISYAANLWFFQALYFVFCCNKELALIQTNILQHKGRHIRLSHVHIDLDSLKIYRSSDHVNAPFLKSA